MADGFGKIADFLFADTNWSIRWLVVDTGYEERLERAPINKAADNRTLP